MRKSILVGIAVLVLVGATGVRAQLSDDASQSLWPVLSGVPDPSRYFDVVSRRAFLMGREAGPMELWITPFKVASNIRISFERDDLSAPLSSESIARWIEVNPEFTKIHFVHEEFSVEEEIKPVDLVAGISITLRARTSKPLHIVVSFVPELKPMWPAGLGGQFCRWDAAKKRYLLGESRRRYNFLIGSPGASRGFTAPAHFLADTPNRFEIDIEPTREGTVASVPVIFIGGEVPQQQAEAMYDQFANLLRISLEKEKPDEWISIAAWDNKPHLPTFEAAKLWSKAALEEGISTNPGLGTGLVAGYGLSGRSERPGFAWFFGGDLFFNQFACNSLGLTDEMKFCLDLIRRNQRDDGKIMHELSQGAPFINWFTDYPYGYYHLETSPYYIISVWNTYLHSGDKTFLKKFWPSMLKAYAYAKTTITEADGLPENAKGGLGALEVGSFLDEMKTDIYVAGLWVEALDVMQQAAVSLKEQPPAGLEALHRKAAESLRTKFFIEGKGYLALGINKNGKAISELTAWPAVPLMFHLLPEDQALPTLKLLNSPEIATDWGMRMLTNKSGVYSPTAYNNGAVWPLLSGYAAMAQFAYRRPQAGWQLIRATYPLVFEGSRGDIAEVYSGDFKVPLDEAVPHQLFSSGALVNAVERGLYGYRIDVANKLITFAPQLPLEDKDWFISFSNKAVGKGSPLIFDLRLKDGVLKLHYSCMEDLTGWKIRFAPSFPLKCRIDTGASPWLKPDMIRMEGDATVVDYTFPIRKFGPDLEITFNSYEWLEIEPPSANPGDRSVGLRYLSSRLIDAHSWSMEIAGLSGVYYDLRLHTLKKVEDLSIRMPGEKGNGWVTKVLVVRNGELVKDDE